MTSRTPNPLIPTQSDRLRIFLHGLLFVAGFSLVCIVGWGGSIPILGQLFATYKRTIAQVSGFIGIYAQAAPLELRITDKEICGKCVGKPCYNGSSAGYGCPWDVFPAG